MRDERQRQEAAQKQVGEYDNKTVEELKGIVKTLTGVKPRFMDKKKLIDIIKTHFSLPTSDGKLIISLD